ncbi:hypothetical protein HanPSC8_Chr01g0000171 [Helianthus annuus]|nr:hypothetical protein HanPSC8_Chr01g0000171 [Helianthus annuus]
MYRPPNLMSTCFGRYKSPRYNLRRNNDTSKHFSDAHSSFANPLSPSISYSTSLFLSSLLS